MQGHWVLWVGRGCSPRLLHSEEQPVGTHSNSVGAGPGLLHLTKLCGAAGAMAPQLSFWVALVGQVARAGGRQLLGLWGQTRGEPPACSKPILPHPWAVLIKELVLTLGYRPGRLTKGCYFVPLHKKKKTQVTNFKTVMNSKLGEIHQISGGYWHVDDNPQKNLLWANSYSVGKRELLHPFTHRALPWERVKLLGVLLLLCSSFISLEPNKRLRSKTQD